MLERHTEKKVESFTYEEKPSKLQRMKNMKHKKNERI